MDSFWKHGQGNKHPPPPNHCFFDCTKGILDMGKDAVWEGGGGSGTTNVFFGLELRETVVFAFNWRN